MFLLWTFGITWSAWILSAVLKERVPLLYPLLMIVGTFGPAISAKLVLGKSLKEMLVFIKFTRKRSWPYLLIFCGAIHDFHCLCDQAAARFESFECLGSGSGNDSSDRLQ